MSDHLSLLRQSLTGSPGPHLDDERLAEIASAEAVREDVDALYTSELQHIESCVQCAEAYSGLVEMTLAAIGDMAAAAQAVMPFEAYAALLTRQVASQITATAELPRFIRVIVDALPLLFTRLPQTATELDVAQLATAVTRITNISSDLSAAVVQVIRRNLSALSAYLTGVSAITWEQNLDVKPTASDRGHRLQLRRGPAFVVPTLSGQEAADTWLVLERQVGQPIPLHVTARAERLSALACRLVVRVDRPGLQHASGRTVQLAYGSQLETAVTDDNGVATFTSIPIAALSKLDLVIEED